MKHTAAASRGTGRVKCTDLVRSCRAVETRRLFSFLQSSLSPLLLSLSSSLLSLCVYVCECECVCMYLYVSPFPRCLGAEGPSAGFLLSLLRGPQRPLIIPDLLDLPLSASHSGPLRLAQVSSLFILPFFALYSTSLCPPHPLLPGSIRRDWPHG